MSSPSPNQEAFEATKIQLSKYSGLAIVPVKEQSGQVELAIREVEAVGKMLADAAGMASRNLRNGRGVVEVKESLGESVRNAKATLTSASQKL